MFAQHFADGILTGAIISLGAIGISFGLQILRFANFSHSELLSWGAYLALAFVAFAGPGTPTGPLSFGWQLIAAMVFAAVLTGGLAWLVDVLVFKRLRNSGAHHLSMVFAAFGAALVMRHVIVLIWGHGTHFYTRELQLAVEVLPGVRMLPDQIFILAVTLLVVVVMHLYLTYSRTGMAMRAMAESPPLARVCGVKVDSVIRWTWIISGVLAAMAAILGGAGSLVGAVVGGLLVGLAENLSVMFISAGYKSAMPFVVLLLVMFFRPQGLFGEKQN